MKTFVFTDDDFSRFAFAVGERMDQFGLTEWSYDVEHDQIGDKVNAQVQYNCVSKVALFRLTKVSEGDFGMHTNVLKLALHEVLHLMLADYAWTASKAQNDIAEVVVSHEHEMINRLMRVIE